ncbi:TetR/AcrR family transcriptional regulator [Vibrio agarivorans]|uniref:TetR/AcrR family transcriptional regulator n=1 Tax=Vibrio agarivorans TaxID=153622 RepID=A0ABT7XYS7_9VIBR|nr:TetR/AcrR family transcriptional regulator [Vibrio agarivorans]MDN2480916.1 TetR/AcrR family transcriptional regulator [Vibrio agarivorans]
MTVTKKSRSEIKREAILSAAREAFLEYGVANTSMDKLSALAGVSKRTVYNHFESKEALVLALLSCLWSNQEALDDEFLLGELTLKEQLKSLIKEQITVASDPAYIELSRVAMGHYLFKPEELRQQVRSIDKKKTNLYQWLFLQAENGRLKLALNQVETAMTQIHHLVKGACYWPQVTGLADILSSEEANQLVDDTVELFWARYGK